MLISFLTDEIDELSILLVSKDKEISCRLIFNTLPDSGIEESEGSFTLYTDLFKDCFADLSHV